MFDCNADNPLPQTDPHAKDATCGSSQLNDSLAVWGVLFAGSIVGLLIVVVYFQSSDWFIAYSQLCLQLLKLFCQPFSFAQEFVEFKRSSHLIQVFLLCCGIFVLQLVGVCRDSPFWSWLKVVPFLPISINTNGWCRQHSLPALRRQYFLSLSGGQQ